jgi:hypothetical protein
VDATTEQAQGRTTDPTPAANLQLDGPVVALTRRTALAALALVLAVGGVAIWAPWSGNEASAERRTIQARNGASEAGSRALAALNTVDADAPEQTVDGWIGLAGGALESKLKQGRTKAIRTMKRGGSRTATVLETAVSAMDETAGMATILGVVEIQATPPGGKATTSVSRFRVLMQRLGTDWKITYLETVRTTS